MNKMDKLISLILLTIAGTLSRYSDKYYSHEISKIKDMVNGANDEKNDK